MAITSSSRQLASVFEMVMSACVGREACRRGLEQVLEDGDDEQHHGSTMIR